MWPGTSLFLPLTHLLINRQHVPLQWQEGLLLILLRVTIHITRDLWRHHNELQWGFSNKQIKLKNTLTASKKFQSQPSIQLSVLPYTQNQLGQKEINRILLLYLIYSFLFLNLFHTLTYIFSMSYTISSHLILISYSQARCKKGKYKYVKAQ